MSTPTIKVLGVSVAEASGSSTDKKVNSRSTLRLHGRVTVYNQDGTFDTVRIRLQGAVRTQIGSQVALEKIPATSVTKTNLDFKPVYSTTRQLTEEQYLDFTCAVPTPRHGAPEAFVPSMTLSGTTYLTKVTALTNRELLQGSCEVLYTLEADFLRSETSKLVRRISCPVDISSSLAPLRAEVTSSGPSDRVEKLAKPQLRSLNRFRGTQSQPGLSIEVPKMLGCIVPDASTVSTGCRRLTVPILVNVSLPSNVRRQSQSLLENEQLKLSVKAKWFTRRTFTTGSSAVESTIHSDRVSTQNYAVTLPPLYKSSTESSKYTTTVELDLLLPESILTPTISTDILNINHTLDLNMKFETSGDNLLRSSFTTNFSLPVALGASQANSMVSLRTFDLLLGLVEEQFLFAPPPYVY
ncbi:hypothetical protein A1O7_03175 [Cladophialophora yegresii CBS 114405]|uniref:Arrestin-like N-terminal domain-containing protein n=1 Tax=Cladophialophora yegresii CBS 114405 TaxID=1182544 RepID=W9W3V6_9EURO|nr:uncharacterized protein A1O7_03175 [Cladophialophora yegresii CBS 114405]EXJ62737.1 hypothetical protein A1O7_03175 [Cladophialophora yegresii CBS 114405]